MTNEEMLNILRHERTEIKDRRGADFSGVEALDMAIKALEQARWIPASKRLPKDYSPCLCTIRNHYTYNNCVEVYCHVVVYDSDEKEWLDESSKLAFDVVAWMPLPQPYKAESEE